MDSSNSTSKPDTKIYKCGFQGCKKTYAKKSRFQHHTRTHMGQRIYTCQESECNKSYFQSSHLKRHCKTAHTEQIAQKFTCITNGCSSNFKTKATLERHVLRKHLKSFAYTCHRCNQGFNRKRQLIAHMFIHTGVPPFHCDHCEATFILYAALNKHKHTHKTYECVCSETFPRWSSLLAHRKICNACRPKCGICNKSFERQANLRLHLKTHTNQPVGEFKCDYKDCKRVYQYKRNLQTHIRTRHQLQKSRKTCTEPGCERTFSKNQNLLKHVKQVHRGEIAEKQKRKTRKDAGTLKRSTAVKLAQVSLPQTVHSTLVNDNQVMTLTYDVFKRIVEEKTSNKDQL